MAVTVQDPHDTQAAMQAASQQVIADLNSNNFADAWKVAQGTDHLYENNSMSAATKDPLLQLMESGQGLTALDPTKKWTAQENADYFKALGQSGGYTGDKTLGKNPYGLWGDQSALLSGKDSAANIAQSGLTPDVGRFAGAKPTQSFLGKYGQDIAMLAAAIVAPEALPALAGVLGGSAVAAGALYGVGSAVAGDLLSGQAITGKGLLAAAVGGGIGGSGLGQALGGGVMGAAGAGAIGGAARGAINGTGIGMGALTGGIGGAISGGIKASGAGGAIAGAVGGGQLGNGIGSAVTGLGSSLLTGAVNGAIRGSPSSGGGNMSNMVNMNGAPGMSTVGQSGGGNFLGLGDLTNSQVVGGIADLGQAGMGMASIGQQSGMQKNAYTTAGNAANSGTNYGSTGLGGMNSQFNNGQLTMNPGSMGPTANGFAQFGTNQMNMANMFGNGGVPQNVTQGFNNFNNQIGQSQMYNSMGQGQSNNVMGMGANTLGSANANFNGAYQTALQSGQQALNPMIQQQSNALLNSNFERGMSGTSGGALQTQALQNSFNTAELQNQNNALNTGLGVYNSTIGAGTSMFNMGAGNMGNFNAAGANFGNMGMQGAMNYNAFSPQLAGMYNNNAQGAVAGFGGINNAMINNNNAGLAGTTNMGNQMNRGAMTQSSGANNWNGGMMGAGSTIAGAFGNMLTGGGTGMMSGIGGAIGNFLNGFNGPSQPNYNQPQYSGDPTNSYGGGDVQAAPVWGGNSDSNAGVYTADTGGG